MSSYFLSDGTPWAELGDGIRRKIVRRTSGLMSVRVPFGGGAIGTSHAGDAHAPIAFVAPRLTMHGVVALDDGAALPDQFSPRRDNYL